jgi:hypothetical protein
VKLAARALDISLSPSGRGSGRGRKPQYNQAASRLDDLRSRMAPGKGQGGMRAAGSWSPSGMVWNLQYEMAVSVDVRARSLAVSSLAR